MDWDNPGSGEPGKDSYGWGYANNGYGEADAGGGYSVGNDGGNSRTCYNCGEAGLKFLIFAG